MENSSLRSPEGADSRLELLLGRDALDALAARRVLLVGVGGVGSWCAEALCRAGIGELTLIDRDRVSESNRNRQLCALGSTVGLPKAEVMAARLRDINPDCLLHPVLGHYEAAERERFFADYDYVVDCIDLVSCKLDLILSCRERGIPIVSALGTGNKRDASLLRLDDIANTYGCALARVMRRELRARGVEHHPVVFSPEEPMKPEQLENPDPGRRSVPGSLVWVPATAGLLLCQHVTLALIEP